MGGTEADAWPSVEWPVVMIDGHDVRLFEERGDRPTASRRNFAMMQVLHRRNHFSTARGA